MKVVRSSAQFLVTTVKGALLAMASCFHTNQQLCHLANDVIGRVITSAGRQSHYDSLAHEGITQKSEIGKLREVRPRFDFCTFFVQKVHPS